MANQPELWAFVLTNVGLFIVSSLLTMLCYLAYRQTSGSRSYAIATIGFGFVVLGGLVAPVFQLGVGIDFTPTGTELMLIEAAETVLTAVGLGLLFYAIVRHGSGSSSSADDHPVSAGEDIYVADKYQPGD